MTVNKAEVGEGTKRIELVLLAEDEALVPTSTVAQSRVCYELWVGSLGLRLRKGN
jgi:hypothetical protein